MNDTDLDIEVLLSHILQCSRTDLYHDLPPLNKSQYYALLRLLKKYQNGVPVAYLTGHKEFMSLDFLVNKDVLIPRPETEILVEESIKLINKFLYGISKTTPLPPLLRGNNIVISPLLKGYNIVIPPYQRGIKGVVVEPKATPNLQRVNRNRRPIILDIGTGSGNIAVSIAKHLRNNSLLIYASDISEKALKTAKINAKLYGVVKHIVFLKGDLFKPFEPLNTRNRVDIIVSNPPYVSKEEYPKLPLSVRKYEPRTALYGGRKGLDYIEKIINRSTDYLKPNGHLLMEIGYKQSKNVLKIAKSNTFLTEIKIIPDYNQIPRVLSARKKTS